MDTAINDKINCIVVDDNFIDRKTTCAYLKQYNFINIVGEFESSIDALQKIKDLRSENQLDNEQNLLLGDLTAKLVVQ